MQDKFDDIVFFEELSPERQGDVRANLDDNPALARAFAHWRQVRAAIRGRIDAALPKRHLLVLYALDEAGVQEALRPEERRMLARSRPDIENVLQSHPGLQEGVARIQDDRTAFEAAWAAHFETETADDHSAARERVDRPPQRSRTRRSASPVRRWVGRAGVVAALALVVAVVSMLLLPSDAERVVVSAGPDEVRQVELADGSTVRLMADSRLAYAAADQAAFDRTVALESGRAFFEVTSASEDFVVETPTARAMAIGTSFGMQVSDVETRVVLADGRLDVASRGVPDQVVKLNPGQASRIARATVPTAPASVDVADALAWTGLFIFRDAAMGMIAERLARHYETSIYVASALRGEGVTGTFERTQPLSEILQTITTALDARVVQIDGGYRIEAAGSA